MKMHKLIIAAAFLALPFMANSALAGDAAKGKEIVDKQCTTCHTFAEQFAKKGKLGPAFMTSPAGQKAGISPDFKYSAGMKKVITDGLMWTDENLDKLLTKPSDLIKGTAMAFPGIKEADKRADVIAFLKSF
ncbi:MAG: c-type cytochrome [Magnetococcus sp. DMHC-6]